MEVNNVKAIRDALKPWISLGEWLLENAGKDKLGAGIAVMTPAIRRRVDEARAALSSPPRNCDVGTADEQCERYKATGETHHTLTLANALAWAQMPYGEEGDGKHEQE